MGEGHAEGKEAAREGQKEEGAAVIHELKRGSSKWCVTILEEHLEMARRGEVVAVAIASIGSDGGNKRVFAQDASGTSKCALIGAIRMLEQMVVDYLLGREGAYREG